MKTNKEKVDELKILLRQSIRELRRFTNGQKSSPSTEVLIDKLWKQYEMKLTHPVVTEEEILKMLSRSIFIIKRDATKWDCYELGWRDCFKAIKGLLNI